MEGNQEGFPDYAEELQKCKDFLAQYQALGEDTRKYVDIMQRVVNREETVVELELDDVLAAALDLEDPALQALIESLPEAPAAARRQCLKMCGMDTGDDDLS